MRIVVPFIVVIVLASQAALADVKRHASIPETLHGAWSPSAGGCGVDDKSVIELAAKAYTSTAAKCAVDWVAETAGPRGPIYSAHLLCASQPAQQPSATNLIIRPDTAQQISIGSDFSKLTAYQKCAAKE